MIYEQRLISVGVIMNLILAAATVSAQSVTADQLLWDNYPNGNGGFYGPSQLDYVFPFESQTADDFVAGDWTITAVEWNGRFVSFDPTAHPDWNIIFYADADGKPTGGPDDPTDTAIVLYSITSDQVSLEQESDYSFTGYVELPEDFVTVEGVIYWIVMQAVFQYPPQWCVNEAIDSHQGYASQAGFPMLDFLYWTDSEDMWGSPKDMCFRLWGTGETQCPADVTGDETVDVLDLLAVLAAWGDSGSDVPEDLNDDGVVDVLDLLIVLCAWGPCS